MNTRVVKSFGLALVVAVGVLALMLALGTFTSQKAGAQNEPVKLELDTTKADTNVGLTLTFDVPNLPPGGTIDITLENLITTSADPTVTIEGARTWPVADPDDEANVATDAFGTTDVALTSASQSDIDGDTPNYGVLMLTVPADTDDTEDTADHDGDEDTANIEQGLKAGKITVNIMPSENIKTSQTVENVKASIVIDVDGSGGDAAASAIESNEVDTGVVLTADPETPGSAAYVTVEVASANGAADEDAGTLIVGTRLAFDMGSFGVPSSIDPDDVTINGLDADGNQIQVATAAAVVVSGKKVTVRVPDMDPETNPPDELSAHYEIVFVQAAGISVPSTAGSYSIKATIPNGTTEIESNDITVGKSLSLDKKSGATGTMVTVTGKGFERDINTLFIDTRTDTTAPNGSPDNDEYIIASGIDVDDGSFKETFTIDSNFETGLNYINTLDVQGNSFSMVTEAQQKLIDGAAPADDANDEARTAAIAAQKILVDSALENGWVTFNLTGIMTLDKTSVRLGENIEITLANFSDGGVTSYKIGNKNLIVDTEGDDAEDLDVNNGSAKFTATVPPALTIGKHQVRVTVTPDDGDDETGSVEITVEGLPLTISPSTAVPGQEVTIRGTGFTAEAALATIEIGGKKASLGSVAILANNSGRIVATITIPKTVSATGANVLVEVTENDASEDDNPGNNRTGVTKITIPKPTLVLDPTTSRPGTPVTASGTGFVAGANVNITYGDATTSTSANSLGAWSKAITVPINTPVGTENDVTAASGIGNPNEADKEATATHEVPGGMVTLSPEQGQPGTTITVSGVGFQAYAAVVKMTVGGLSVLTGAINTDANGDFTASILLPALPAGTTTFFVGVGGTADAATNRESLTFTVTDAPPPMVSADPADVFADLIEAGTLVEVLQLVRTSDTDITWLFYKPGEMFEDFNTYSESESGDILFVNVSSQTTFQGKTLYTGWNQHVLN